MPPTFPPVVRHLWPMVRRGLLRTLLLDPDVRGALVPWRIHQAASTLLWLGAGLALLSSRVEVVGAWWGSQRDIALLWASAPLGALVLGRALIVAGVERVAPVRRDGLRGDFLARFPVALYVVAFSLLLSATLSHEVPLAVVAARGQMMVRLGQAWALAWNIAPAMWLVCFPVRTWRGLRAAGRGDAPSHSRFADAPARWREAAADLQRTWADAIRVFRTAWRRWGPRGADRP